MVAHVVLRVLMGLGVSFITLLKFHPTLLDKLSHGLQGLAQIRPKDMGSDHVVDNTLVSNVPSDENGAISGIMDVLSDVESVISQIKPIIETFADEGLVSPDTVPFIENVIEDIQSLEKTVESVVEVLPVVSEQVVDALADPSKQDPPVKMVCVFVCLYNVIVNMQLLC
jgi:hypothetical protein